MRIIMQIKLFTAQWCSQCQSMKQVLNNMGLEFETIDIDTEQGSVLAQQHKVRSLPTTLLQIGDSMTVVVGSKNKAFMEGLIQELSNG